MNPALAAIAAVTIAGGVLAVSARDVRTAALGLLIVLLGLPLIADPWPDPLSILVRTAATLLAVRLVAIGLRGAEFTGGTRIGWPAEALLAAAGALGGFGSHGLGAAGLGPAEAGAAGFGLVVLALAPLATGRDVLRLAVGAVLVLAGALAVRSGLDRTPGQAEQLVDAILTIGIGGAIAVVATAARAAGGLDAIETAGARELGRRLPDAHRIPDRPVRDAAPTRPPVAPVLGSKPSARATPSEPEPPRRGPSEPEPPRRGPSDPGPSAATASPPARGRAVPEPSAPAASPPARGRAVPEPSRTRPTSRRTPKPRAAGPRPAVTPDQTEAGRPGADLPDRPDADLPDRPDADLPDRSETGRARAGRRAGRRTAPPEPPPPSSTEAEP